MGIWRGSGVAGRVGEGLESTPKPTLSLRTSFEQALSICMKANFVGLNEAMVPIGEHSLDGERKKRV